MRLIIFCTLLLAGNWQAYCQVKLGLQLSPSISNNRVNSDSKSHNIDKDEAELRFKFGLLADFPFSDNYSFTTGFIFAPKHAGVTTHKKSSNQIYKEAHKLQYIQIPLGIKLVTNEIAIDKKLYFKVGLTAEVMISEKFEKSKKIVNDFRFFDTSLMLGGGAEYKLGTSTALFVGIMYQRGLVNQASSHVDIGGDLTVKNDMISLDMGVIF